jgi:hypothetical protein
VFLLGKSTNRRKKDLETEFDDTLAQNLTDWEEGQTEEKDDLRDELHYSK